MLYDRVADSLNLRADANPSLLQDNATTAKQIRDLIRYMESKGAVINPASRLYQYAALFEDTDDASVTTLDHALLEVLQFLAVARAFNLTSDVRQWVPALSSARTGHVRSDADRFDSRARSDQFELFTMACLTAAGFRVERAEPDLRAHIDGVEVAFAAKRLRSVGKLDDNLRDARRQIVGQGIPGFIVVDLSFVNLIHKPVYVPRLEQQQSIAAVLLDGFAQQHQGRIFRAAAKPHVLGILLHASVVGRSIEPASRFVSRRWLLCADKDSAVSRELITAIQESGRKPWPSVELVRGSKDADLA